jgi:hypothetical protein
MTINKAQGYIFYDMGAKPKFIHRKFYAVFSRMRNFDCVKIFGKNYKDPCVEQLQIVGLKINRWQDHLFLLIL